jgi:hypothetical protein
MSSLDIADLKKNIYSAVDCGMTFANLPKGDPCPAGGYWTLRTIDNKVFVDSNGTSFGPNNQYSVRAYCSGGVGGGLDIRVVRWNTGYSGSVGDISWVGQTIPTNPAAYLADEARPSELSYDWLHPKSRISQPGPGGLCSGWFGNSFNHAPTCSPPGQPAPPNQYISNVDFDRQT